MKYKMQGRGYACYNYRYMPSSPVLLHGCLLVHTFSTTMPTSLLTFYFTCFTGFYCVHVDSKMSISIKNVLYLLTYIPKTPRQQLSVSLCDSVYGPFSCHDHVRVQGNGVLLYECIYSQFGRFRKALRRIRWSKIIHGPEIIRFCSKKPILWQVRTKQFAIFANFCMSLQQCILRTLRVLLGIL